jgi:hypothetical protein
VLMRFLVASSNTWRSYMRLASQQPPWQPDDVHLPAPDRTVYGQ